jgi:type III secretion protein C
MKGLKRFNFMLINTKSYLALSISIIQANSVIRKIVFISWLTVFFVTTTVRSQNLPDFSKQGPFEYFAESQSIRELLTSMSSNYGLAISISDRINDQIKGHFGPSYPKNMLNQLSKIYNLSWYYDGAVLYVYKNDEVVSELIQLGSLTEPELRRAIHRTGIWDSRFSWQASPSQDVVYISGPPRYIQLITQFTKALKDQRVAQKPLFVDIIPLKYATAIDRVIEYRDQSIQVPGVASILQRILTGAQVNLATQSDSKRSAKQSQESSVLAKIEAEPSLNAIIVRDNQSRLPLYRELVKQLDIPQERIEIGVTIIDVSANDADQIGVDWAAGIDVGGNNSALDISTTGNQDENFFSLSNGTDFNTLLTGNRLNYVLGRVRLLEGRGDAQIVSRPTLLTQENIQAVLDDSSTFYVRVSGTEVADLREVTYGTQLRLTPRILGEKGDANPEIQLSIHIEDGSLVADGEVGGLPSTRNTIIDTLATVPHGKSLLIGGVYRNSIEHNVRKVPFLGDIPVIGALFRSKNTQVRKLMRLFIVEPKRVIEDLPAIGFLPTPDLDVTNIDWPKPSNTNPELNALINTNQCINKDQAIKQQAELSSINLFSWLEPCGDNKVNVRISKCSKRNADNGHCQGFN